jgi:hypothetical protein
MKNPQANSQSKSRSDAIRNPGLPPNGTHFVAARREPSGSWVGITDENRAACADSANNDTKVSAIGLPPPVTRSLSNPERVLL